MKLSILASGSKGNCTYLETENHKILIDMGTTCKYIENKLMELETNPNSIDYIFITHDHNDHISALKVFLKKYSPTVYMTEKLHKTLKEKIEFHNIKLFTDSIKISNLTINSIKTSHDATDGVGFLFETKKSSLVYITDTGYINKKYFEILKNKTAYILESNHDIEMLMNGKYRHDLKVRILGDKGHLSNEMSTQYLTSFIGNQTKHIFLAHLSEENNTEELAYNTLNNKLKEENIEGLTIMIAKQNERTDLIEV